MFEIGKYITLTILRETDPGLYLGKDAESEEVVLLPHKYKPETFEIGDEIRVFIYLIFQIFHFYFLIFSDLIFKFAELLIISYILLSKLILNHFS